jgi:hypothetical protein
MNENAQEKETRFDRFLRRYAPKIADINRKYAKPKIKMTKGVRFALLMLRLYLIILVCLLVYKFVTLVHG